VVVHVLVMAAEMDLAHRIQREGVDIGARVPALVGGGDEDVVDVEQEPAAACAARSRSGT
jgi:hypothetical protein